MTDAEMSYVLAVGTPAEQGAAAVLYEKGYDSDWLAHFKRVGSMSPRAFVEECDRAVRRERRGELGMTFAREAI